MAECSAVNRVIQVRLLTSYQLEDGNSSVERPRASPHGRTGHDNTDSEFARPAPHGGQGVECAGGVARRRWAAARCGAEQAGVDSNRVAAASGLVSRGCRVLSHLGLGAGPVRKRASGQGSEAAQFEAPAMAHPLRRERGARRRHCVDEITSLASLVETEHFRALLRHRWRRTDASSRPTRMAWPSRWLPSPRNTATSPRSLLLCESRPMLRSGEGMGSP